MKFIKNLNDEKKVCDNSLVSKRENSQKIDWIFLSGNKNAINILKENIDLCHPIYLSKNINKNLDKN